MPAECSTCARPDLGDIHRAIDAGGGINKTARIFKIPPATLKLHLRHRSEVDARRQRPEAPPSSPSPSSAPTPAPEPSKPARAEEPAASAVEPDLPLGDLEGRIAQLARTADRLRVAAENGTLRERGAALGEARRTVETLTDLHLRLSHGREADLLRSSQWVALRAVLLDALGPFPEAREAVTEAMRRHEGA